MVLLLSPHHPIHHELYKPKSARYSPLIAFLICQQELDAIPLQKFKESVKQGNLIYTMELVGLKTKDPLASRLGDSIEEPTRSRGLSTVILPSESSISNTILNQQSIEDTQEWQDTERRLRANEANFDFAGRPLAPNGQQSKLPYREWVAVRTPSFINWFGDWFNDPSNASKVVDDNGEPKVVYHASAQWFRVFNDGSEQHQSFAPDGTIFTNDNRDVANSYIYWYGLSNGRMPRQAHNVYLNENDSRHDSYGGYIHREGGIYSLFLNIRNPMIVDFNGRTWQSSSDDILEDADINDYASWAKQDGYDGLIARNIIDVGATDHAVEELPATTDYVAFSSNQVKSVDNRGTFDSSNPDILYQSAVDRRMDEEYFSALERNDMETVQRIVDSQARKKGYISDDDFRDMHGAPTNDGLSVNIKDLANGSDLIPQDYFSDPDLYGASSEEGGVQAFNSIKRVIEWYKNNPDKNYYIRMYRAVPSDLKEDQFRNGDWISPSREYAEAHGKNRFNGNYRIVTHSVRADHVYWNGDSVNEWGYDDGENYAYQNTKNNRKLLDAVVRDYDGNIVPPSKRFNKRAYEVFYQLSPEYVRENFDYPSRIPEDEDFLKAVEGTEGARLVEDGIIIDLERWQKPEQDSAQSVRTGVFYLPRGNRNIRAYMEGSGNFYGGSVHFTGETLLKSPYVVKGTTGGSAPLKAYEQVMGKEAASELKKRIRDLLSIHKESGRRAELEGIFYDYNIDDTDAYDVILNSREGNQLMFAVQENIIAHALRDEGYDSIVAYRGSKITEIFDLREGNYPSEISDTPWMTHSPNTILFQSLAVEGVTDEESAYAKARPMIGHYNGEVRQMALEVGLDINHQYEGFKNESYSHTIVMRPDLKSPESARRKVEDELEGRWDLVKDMYGGTLVFETIEDAKKAFEKFKEGNAEIRLKPKEFSNAGYRDYKFTIKQPNGALFELILNDVDTFAVKMEGLGHNTYEAIRVLEPRIEKANVYNLDAKDVAFLEELLDCVRKWQEIEYSLGREFRLDYQRYLGSSARKDAISDVISFLSKGSDSNRLSAWLGSLSTILPSTDSILNTDITLDLRILLNGISSISKYLTLSSIDFSTQSMNSTSGTVNTLNQENYEDNYPADYRANQLRLIRMSPEERVLYMAGKNRFYRELDLWTDATGEDMLPFLNRNMAAIVSRNMREDAEENPWSVSRFININGRYEPSSHQTFKTKRDAVRSLAEERYEFRSTRDLLFQDSIDDFFDVEEVDANYDAVREDMDANLDNELKDIMGQLKTIASNFTDFEDYRTEVENQWITFDDDLIERAWNETKSKTRYQKTLSQRSSHCQIRTQPQYQKMRRTPTLLTL